VDVASAVGVIDARMAQQAQEHGIPDIAYGLVLAGETVHVGSIGRLSVAEAIGTPFRIASMTKSFTAATVLSLRDEGLLSLDAPIAEYLPWASAIGLPASAPPLRLAHLLTMTAGFPTDDPWGDRQESLPLADFDALVAGGLTFCRPPGLEFEYANIGYALLGRVIAHVTGKDYRAVVRDRILEPLGMASSTFDVASAQGRMTGMHPTAAGLVEQAEGPSGAFSPMGGLWSTVGDLARWVDFLESAWADAPDMGVLSRWSRREMQRPHIVVGHEPDGSIDSYGLGLRITDHPHLGRFVHHSGGYPGFGSHMRWHPDTRWGVVALANRTYAPMRLVCADVLAEIVADEAVDAARSRAVERLWPQTERAMQLAESLLVAWDDVALDAVAAVNLDLDQSREERAAAWHALGVGSVVRDVTSVTSPSPAHARWTVTTDVGPIELGVLLTGEREPRIQALTARPLARGREGGAPQ
jgi:CubicO group peptidase (beta-lactamase class C family)